MSRFELAARLGMSFQNVQKDQRASNRISASVLWQVAEALRAPVGFFFDGLDRAAASTTAPFDFLRFPEFPGLNYRPTAGSGVVFSCSLLHEAMPVTRGRRFGIFGFFW